jgi:hypothetical protein
MSANPKGDLEQVKIAFENFRGGRRGKERVPENLWSQAIALLEHYPFRVVCRELRLKPNYLRQRAEAVEKGSREKFKLHRSVKRPRANPQQDFFRLTARDLSALPSQTQLLPSSSACRVMIERADGSRLQLTVAMDWARIEREDSIMPPYQFKMIASYSSLCKHHVHCLSIFLEESLYLLHIFLILQFS